MSWSYLFLAGLFEVAWAYGLKVSDGFSKPLPSVVTVLLMLASFGLLSVAMKELPLGTAYAVWTGIGAVGTVLVGVLFLGESRDWQRMVCVLLIVVGIVGLKVLGGDKA